MFQDIDEYIVAIDIENIKKEFYYDEYVDYRKTPVVFQCGCLVKHEGRSPIISSWYSSFKIKYRKIEKFLDFVYMMFRYHHSVLANGSSFDILQHTQETAKEFLNKIITTNIIKQFMESSDIVINYHQYFYQKVIVENKPDEFLIPSPTLMEEFLHSHQLQQEKIKELTIRIDALSSIVLELKAKSEL